MVDIRKRYLVNIVASAKDSNARNMVPLPGKSIQPGFALCAYGPEKQILEFVQDYGLILREEANCFKDTMFNPSMAGIVEAVVSPRSVLIGRTIKESRFRETFGITALAIHQIGKNYYRELADRLTARTIKSTKGDMKSPRPRTILFAIHSAVPV